MHRPLLRISLLAALIVYGAMPRAAAEGVALNGTITDALTGARLASAYVQLKQAGFVKASVLSRADGTYLLTTTLPAGTYDLVVSRSGYTSVTRTGLTLGTQPTTHDVALTPILHSGVTLYGNVTDAQTQQPLNGASVQLKQGTLVKASAMTRPDGSYLLTTTLPTGTYDLVGSRTSYVPTTQAGLALAANQPLRRDAALTPGIQLQGSVTDASTQSPLSGVTIQLWEGTVVKASTNTSTTGTYTLLTSLPAGTYTLVATKSGYAKLILPDVSLPAGLSTRDLRLLTDNPVSVTLTGTTRDARTQQILGGVSVQLRQLGAVKASATSQLSTGVYTMTATVSLGLYELKASKSGYQEALVDGLHITAAGTRQQDVSLTPGVAVSGLVRECVFQGPLAGVSLQLKQNGVLKGQASSDVTGAYRLTTSLPNGVYELLAVKTGYGTETVSGLGLEATNPAVRDVTLCPAGGVALSGRITDAFFNASLASAYVYLKQGTLIKASTSSRIDGTYLLTTTLPAGTYDVVVSRSGYTTVTRTGLTLGTQPTTHDVALTPILHSGVTLYGNVTDAQTQQALSGASIQLEQAGVYKAGTSSRADGTYLLTTTLPAGQYTLVAIKTGYVTLTQEMNPSVGPQRKSLALTSGSNDTTPPTVTITSPTSSSTYSTSRTPLSIAGTAGDNIGVTQIRWSTDRGGSGTASGTTSWRFDLQLPTGDARITVTARDAAGNTGSDFLTVTVATDDDPPPASGSTSRGYQPRACGLDLNGDGIIGNTEDCGAVCNGPAAARSLSLLNKDGTRRAAKQLFVYPGMPGRDSTKPLGSAQNPYGKLTDAIAAVDAVEQSVQDIICIGGTITDVHYTAPKSGIPGTYRQDPRPGTSEQQTFYYPTKPFMIVGWDRNGNHAYPPYDAADIAVIDGKGKHQGFWHNGPPSHVEYAHFRAVDFGNLDYLTTAFDPVGVPPSGFLGFNGTRIGTARPQRYIYVHDIDLQRINKKLTKASNVHLFNGWGKPDTIREYIAVENILCNECAGYFMRGSGSAKTEGDGIDGPYRFKNMTIISYGCDNTTDARCQNGALGNFASRAAPVNFKLWNEVGDVEVIDNIWDANYEQWHPSNHSSAPVGANCDTVNFWIVNNLVMGYSGILGSQPIDDEQSCTPGFDTRNFVIDRNLLVTNGKTVKAVQFIDISEPGGGPRNVRVTNNVLYAPYGYMNFINNIPRSCQFAATDKFIVANNTIYGPLGVHPGSGNRVATFDFDTDDGEQAIVNIYGQSCPAHPNIEIKNNIVAGLERPLGSWMTQGQGGTIYHLGSKIPMGSLAINNNVYSRTPDFSSSVLTWASWKQAGKDTASMIGTPSFLSLPSNAETWNYYTAPTIVPDLHVRDNATNQSLLFDKGLNLSALFSTDMDNELRPATGAWDIGADQASDDTPPPADTTPPVVVMTGPSGDQSLSGTMTVTAQATDNVGVVGVQFLLNGQPLGAEDTSHPYSVSWNTTQVADGAQALGARARDAARNTGTADPVSVLVLNDGGDD